MRLDPVEARRRFATGRVAHLATLRPDGTAALVPIVFEAIGDRVVSAVDPKPKRTPELARLGHIARDPRVALLVDHYEDDWKGLWWVRVDGAAQRVDDAAEAGRAIDLLVDRYPQYARARPGGPVVAISIERMSGWSAA